MATLTLKIGATGATLNGHQINMNKKKDKKDAIIAFKAAILKATQQTK